MIDDERLSLRLQHEQTTLSFGFKVRDIMITIYGTLCLVQKLVVTVTQTQNFEKYSAYKNDVNNVQSNGL